MFVDKLSFAVLIQVFLCSLFYFGSFEEASASSHMKENEDDDSEHSSDDSGESGEHGENTAEDESFQSQCTSLGNGYCQDETGGNGDRYLFCQGENCEWPQETCETVCLNYPVLACAGYEWNKSNGYCTIHTGTIAGLSNKKMGMNVRECLTCENAGGITGKTNTRTCELLGDGTCLDADGGKGEYKNFCSGSLCKWDIQTCELVCKNYPLPCAGYEFDVKSGECYIHTGTVDSFKSMNDKQCYACVDNMM